MSTARLRDGREVRMRDARPADGEAIVSLYESLSEESLRRRFVGGGMSAQTVRRLAVPDLDHGVGSILAELAAQSGGPLLGEARFIRTRPDAAEFAMVVRDDVQGQGLGRLLLATLVARARDAGVPRLDAEVLVSNTPMLHLLGAYGWVLTEATEECTTFLQISTTGGVAGWDEDAPHRPRVLVESRSWFDDAETARWRAAGHQVRRCLGPRRDLGWACPLVDGDGCRLAEGADVVVAHLRPDTPETAAILAAHQAHWPERLSE